MASFELISLDKRAFAKRWLAIDLVVLFGDLAGIYATFILFVNLRGTIFI